MPKKNTKYTLQDRDIILDNDDKKYILRVRDLPVEDKPRERMVKQGVKILSSAELLAVVLGTGTKKEEVLAMANRLLSEYGAKAVAIQGDPAILSKDLDIPLVKACQIVACFELGRRFCAKSSPGSTTIRTAKQAFEYLKDMGTLTKENLRGVYLDSHYKVIHDEVISVGSLTANIVHPREVLRPALEHCAAAFIVAHNHPSGDPTPTASDLQVTQQLQAAGKLMGIDLLDHIIIAKNKFISIPVGE